MGASGEVVVFLGPSLAAAPARELLDATFLPPARRGDVAAAVARRPRAIALVDGLYERVPAVSHKEILWAIGQGVPVLGAASMGALRAAELDRHGMVGVGQVYRWLRDGRFCADDAVAVAHLPASHGFRSMSVALVDIVATLDAAAGAGVLDAPIRERLEAIASSLHYTERTWPALWGTAGAAGVTGHDVAALRDWVAGHHRSLKARDAQELLRRLADGSWAAPGPADAELADTVHWRRLRARSGTYDLAAISVATLHDAATRVGGLEDHFRSLAAQLAVAVVRAWGVEFEPGRALAVLCERLGLDGESLEGWMRANDLDEAGLARLAVAQAALDWAVGAFHDDAVEGIADVLRVRGRYESIRDLAARDPAADGRGLLHQ